MSMTYRGFINISTGRPSSCDTEVTLDREENCLVARARCRCDATGVSAHDRLTVVFVPVGREADVLSVQVAPDASITTAGLKFLLDAGVIYGNEGGTRNAARAMWSDRTPEVGVNNDIPTESRLHPNGWGMLLVE